MNFKLLLIFSVVVLTITCQSDAKSIGSEVEFSNNQRDIRVLSKREAENAENDNDEGSQSSSEGQESESNGQSESNSQSSGEVEEAVNPEQETENEQTETINEKKNKSKAKENSKNTKQNSAEKEAKKDEKNEKKKGCSCKSCPNKNSKTQNSPANCPCENCPRKNTKGCPFMRGILNRTQDPSAAIASEFLKALKNALNGTNPSGTIQIVVAIAGHGGNVQINAADGNVTSFGNASVKVVQINQSKENTSNAANETDFQSEAGNSVDAAGSSAVSESEITITAVNQETTSAEEPESQEATTADAQLISSTTQESPAVEESTASA